MEKGQVTGAVYRSFWNILTNIAEFENHGSIHWSIQQTCYTSLLTLFRLLSHHSHTKLKRHYNWIFRLFSSRRAEHFCRAADPIILKFFQTRKFRNTREHQLALQGIILIGSGRKAKNFKAM